MPNLRSKVLQIVVYSLHVALIDRGFVTPNSTCLKGPGASLCEIMDSCKSQDLSVFSLNKTTKH